MTRNTNLDFSNASSSSTNANIANDQINICRTCVKVFRWLPVLLITVILIWSYYAYVVQLCIFVLTDNTLQRTVYLIFYHILLFLLLWSYGQTIFTDTGEVPQEFKIPSDVMDKLLQSQTNDQQRRILERFARNLPIVNTNEIGSVRYCDKCQHIKPDRTHHCSVCGRCILKMDHHCPWVNNCISFYNYKFFILLLGYSMIYCLYVGLTSLPYFILFWHGKLEGYGHYHVLTLFVMAIMFGIGLGSLFGYHCCLVCNNRTTLESLRAPYFRTGEDKDGFNIGHCRNFEEVFGVNVTFWFIPIYTSLGDGVEFPTRQLDEDSEQLLSSLSYYSSQ